MKRGTKLLLAVAAALLIIFNLDRSLDLFGKIGRAAAPLGIGLILALILNVFVRFFDEIVFLKIGRKKLKRTLSLITVAIVFFGGMTGLGFLIVPELISNVNSVKTLLPSLQSGDLSAVLGDGTIGTFVAEHFSGWIAEGAKSVANAIPDAKDALKSIVSSAGNFLMGLLLGVLMIAEKEEIAGGLKKMAVRWLGKDRAEVVAAGAEDAAAGFSRFLGGQLIEGVLFGAINYLVYLAFGIPYAALAGVIMGIANMIPIVGSYVGGAAAFLLIFTVSPEKALIFVLIVIVLQQIEQFTLYPVVVGRYVGLSAFSITVAVALGGGLFGFWGLLLGVPVASFLQTLSAALRARKEMKEKNVYKVDPNV